MKFIDLNKIRVIDNNKDSHNSFIRRIATLDGFTINNIPCSLSVN